ncbi:MAG TPA: OmpA family protein [Anaeromyxobacter sp.]|nr:OmpA family protein [Anaeromyxobacter sp.]
MRSLAVVALVGALSAPAAARAQAWDAAKGVVGKATTGALEREINRRLLAESRRNQCSFITDSDRLAPGCDAKIRRLANALIGAKKRINGAGIKNFKFVVSGHTDSRGSAAHNKELSAKRAAVIERELIRKGIPKDDIESVGMGSERRLVKPDDTPAKQAKNRRYELQVRL